MLNLFPIWKQVFIWAISLFVYLLIDFIINHVCGSLGVNYSDIPRIARIALALAVFVTVDVLLHRYLQHSRK